MRQENRARVNPLIVPLTLFVLLAVALSVSSEYKVAGVALFVLWCLVFVSDARVANLGQFGFWTLLVLALASCVAEVVLLARESPGDDAQALRARFSLYAAVIEDAPRTQQALPQRLGLAPLSTPPAPPASALSEAPATPRAAAPTAAALNGGPASAPTAAQPSSRTDATGATSALRSATQSKETLPRTERAAPQPASTQLAELLRLDVSGGAAAEYDWAAADARRAPVLAFIKEKKLRANPELRFIAKSEKPGEQLMKFVLNLPPRQRKARLNVLKTILQDAAPAPAPTRRNVKDVLLVAGALFAVFSQEMPELSEVLLAHRFFETLSAEEKALLETLVAKVESLKDPSSAAALGNLTANSKAKKLREMIDSFTALVEPKERPLAAGIVSFGGQRAVNRSVLKLCLAGNVLLLAYAVLMRSFSHEPAPPAAPADTSEPESAESRV